MNTTYKPKHTKVQVVDKIANQLIERMFFACANDAEVNTYFELLEKPVRGHGLATSYASRKVSKQFIVMLTNETGIDYSEIMSSN